MTTGAFSQNVGKLFSELKLVTDNLLSMQQPTEKPLKVYYSFVLIFSQFRLQIVSQVWLRREVRERTSAEMRGLK